MRIPAPLAIIAAILAAPTLLAAQVQRDQDCVTTAGTGAIHGTVVDRETLIPLQSAEVAVRWFASERVRASERRIETDRRGRFRLCDLPRDVRLQLHAEFMGEESEARTLSLTSSDAAPEVIHVKSPHSTLSGRVIEHETKRGIAMAAVRLGAGVAQQITSTDGTFVFDKLPPGVYPLEVQHLAFLAVIDSVHVEYMSTVTATIRMAPNVIPMSALEVSVRKAFLDRVGFYLRQERSGGSFLTRTDIENMHPLNGTDIMRRVPGVRIQRGRFGNVLLGRGACPFRYVMDGARVGPGFSLDDLTPHAIEAVEVYMGPSQVPIEFQGFSSDANGMCGVIVIWTRRGD
jgi:hypothetical protein